MDTHTGYGQTKMGGTIKHMETPWYEQIGIRTTGDMGSPSWKSPNASSGVLEDCYNNKIQY